MTKRCRRGAFLSVAIALAALAAMASSASASLGLNAYEVDGSDPGAARTLAEAGFDVHEGGGGEAIEIIASRSQVAGLRKQGLDPELKVVDGMTARQFAVQDVNEDGSYDVYRPYFNDECTPETCYVGQEGGDPRQTLYQEMLQLAADNPAIVKPVEIGRTINDVPILALRVTRDAREASNPDGSKPAALYSAAQHAREWITPEMVRRLAHLYIDNYGGTGTALGTDGEPVDGVDSENLTRLVNERELWFVFVANPDGYDFTFSAEQPPVAQEPARQQRRRRDHVGDGVDPNRNFPTNLNYDNEGSSSDPADDTYRGAGPASEPETQAMDGLLRRVGFEFKVNYHSAAELLLYRRLPGPDQSPDDTLYQALSGTDLDPAIPVVARERRTPTTPTSLGAATRPTARPPSTPTRATGRSPGPRDGRLRSRAGRRHERLRVPGLRGRPAGGVREEHAVRARRGRFGRRSGRTRSRTWDRGSRLPDPTRSTSPTAIRRRSR